MVVLSLALCLLPQLLLHLLRFQPEPLLLCLLLRVIPSQVLLNELLLFVEPLDLQLGLLANQVLSEFLFDLARMLDRLL